MPRWRPSWRPRATTATFLRRCRSRWPWRSPRPACPPGPRPRGPGSGPKGARNPAARVPPGASSARAWERLEGDEDAGVVRRPPGLALDSGGLAKGLFADELASTLCANRSFAVDCAGDIALGGAAALDRTVDVESPFDGSTLHRF